MDILAASKAQVPKPRPAALQVLPISGRPPRPLPFGVTPLGLPAGSGFGGQPVDPVMQRKCASSSSSSEKPCIAHQALLAKQPWPTRTASALPIHLNHFAPLILSVPGCCGLPGGQEAGSQGHPCLPIAHLAACQFKCLASDVRLRHGIFASWPRSAPALSHVLSAQVCWELPVCLCCNPFFVSCLPRTELKQLRCMPIRMTFCPESGPGTPSHPAVKRCLSTPSGVWLLHMAALWPSGSRRFGGWIP